jgi:carbonic anhydrase/acetyltransferase-like protein (isoleucine patch superfamily)
MFIPYFDTAPHVSPFAFIAEGAKLVGDVTVGADTGIWFNAVLRGDLAPVKIGEGTNIQDGCIVHVNTGQPATIGDGVSVGHNCILHGCTIASHCLIGMGSIIMNDVEIGEYSVVGAGSLITDRKVFPPRSLILGSPAKFVREINDAEMALILGSAASYQEALKAYLEKIVKL